MNATKNKLFTPIYLKLTPEMPWPEHEPVFHLLSRDGLFVCRNHPFFRSCARTNVWPGELAEHEPSLQLNYPKLPQRLFEKIIGFFARIGLRHGAEAAVLLAWNKKTNRMEVIVPEQTSIVSSRWAARPYPIEVHYEVPPLPSHLMLIGDIHSHVDDAAYASYMDRQDEEHRSGLHVVVGRISDEPPELHVEATVDGTRFKINDLALVIEGYERRRLDEVPAAWEQRVKITTWADYYKSGSSHGMIPEASSNPSAHQVHRPDPLARSADDPIKSEGSKSEDCP